MSEQSNAAVQGPEPGGYAVSSEFNSNDIDLTFLKDFLVTLQGCNVARFSGYGVSVDFGHEGGNFGVAPAPLSESLNATAREERDAWRNPNLWPQQNGRVLKFDGSLE